MRMKAKTYGIKCLIIGRLRLVPIVHKKSCILVTSDNMYMTSQRMKAYFIDFFFHLKFVVVYD